MPTITKADTIIKLAKDLDQALQGNLPKNYTIEAAIKKLMDIFQQEAADYVRPKNVPRQRVNMEAPPSQRMTATSAEKKRI